jgi:hypothetical protein
MIIAKAKIGVPALVEIPVIGMPVEGDAGGRDPFVGMPAIAVRSRRLSELVSSMASTEAFPIPTATQ